MHQYIFLELCKLHIINLRILRAGVDFYMHHKNFSTLEKNSLKLFHFWTALKSKKENYADTNIVIIIPFKGLVFSPVFLIFNSRQKIVYSLHRTVL